MASVFKVDDQTIRPGKAWTDANGIQHPGAWNTWPADQKEAAGIVELVQESPPDSRLYDWGYDDDGVTIIKKAKSLADVNEVDLDGNAIKDADGNQLVTPGVKWNLKQEVKKQQGSLLAQTDWAVVRKADTGADVPSNIQTWRDAIRTKATEMEDAIDGAANTDAIAVLFLTFDIDGNKSGILYDWPKLDR